MFFHIEQVTFDWILRATFSIKWWYPVRFVRWLTVKKWKTIKAWILKHGYYVKDDGSDTCAFCLKYGGCEKCPVRLHTKEWGCINTPYIEYSNASRLTNYRELLKMVDNEIEFLENLPL